MEARNSTDYRFQIKSVFQEKITNCINIVFEEIEKKKTANFNCSKSK